MRINKYLALCGIASRRGSEQMVLDGRVKLNGRPITKLSTEIRPGIDIVMLDGEKLQPQIKHVYLMLHKPKGYLCTASDERGRKTILELLPPKYKNERVFPVGRLDYDTEGLIFLTTDGDTAHGISHPSFEVKKTYIAKVEGAIAEDELNKIRGGIMLDGERTKPCKAKLLEFDENVSKIEVTITEGLNRQIRRMFEAINRDVIFLKRTEIGEIRLGGLTRGTCRELREKELLYLKTLKPSKKPSQRDKSKPL